MLTFDITQEPPTFQELDAEKQRLSLLKKQLIRRSIVSDTLHCALLLCLYLTDILSGYGFLVVAGLGTVIALLLASMRENGARATDLFTIGLVALVAAGVSAGSIYFLFDDSVIGCAGAGLITGSIVIASTLIGRPMLQIFTGMEMLKSVAGSAAAEQELQSLCRDNPVLQEYRQQALHILRPNLTFGELQAMRALATQGQAE